MTAIDSIHCLLNLKYVGIHGIYHKKKPSNLQNNSVFSKMYIKSSVIVTEN